MAPGLAPTPPLCAQPMVGARPWPRGGGMRASQGHTKDTPGGLGHTLAPPRDVHATCRGHDGKAAPSVGLAPMTTRGQVGQAPGTQRGCPRDARGCPRDARGCPADAPSTADTAEPRGHSPGKRQTPCDPRKSMPQAACRRQWVKTPGSADAERKRRTMHSVGSANAPKPTALIRCFGLAATIRPRAPPTGRHLSNLLYPRGPPPGLGMKRT